MPGDDGSQSKTEQATPKKRKDQRKKGNAFQSKDIISLLSILLMFIVLNFILPFMYTRISLLALQMFENLASIETISMEILTEIVVQGMTAFWLTIIGMVMTSTTVAVLASAVQTKFLISFESIKFKPSKMNPLEGIKKMFSLKSLFELAKSIIKISIIGGVLWNSVKGILVETPKLMDMDIMAGIVFILESVFVVVLQISIAFVIIAFLDYLYQWWDFEKNLKMTKQEIKEEYKQMEGDPHVKGKIKEIQRKAAMQRMMMQDVPTADVIVRNPTHYAVAIKYELGVDEAPIIVAKGKDLVALKIIEIAAKNNILMKEDKPLARALYDVVPVGALLPEEFFGAVVEILRWVYQVENRTLTTGKRKVESQKDNTNQQQ